MITDGHLGAQSLPVGSIAWRHDMPAGVEVDDVTRDALRALVLVAEGVQGQPTTRYPTDAWIRP